MSKNKKAKIKSPKYTKEDKRIPTLPTPKREERLLSSPNALVSATSNPGKRRQYRDATSWTAQVITNIPYTPNDYLYFEDAWSWTLAGLAVDKKMDFVIGRGINPTIELLDKKDLDEGQITQITKKYKYVIDALKKVDSTPAINLKQTVYDAARMAKVFGRSVLAFEYGTEDNSGPPVAVKIIHPRDLGRVQVNELNWTIESVINYMGMSVGSSSYIKSEDMIYFVNQPNNPMRRNLFYGHSEMQRVIGVARAMRRVLEYDIPEIVEAMWAGYGLFLVDPEGKQASDIQAELSTLLGNLSPGTFGAVSGKPNEKVQFIPLNLQPNVAGIVSLIDVFERLLIGNQGVPAALLGREEDSNLATLFGKIRLFLAGPVAQDREWLGNILDLQWYNPLLKKLFPELTKIIKIKTEFEPIITESWIDNIDALQKLKLTIPDLPQEKLLELVGLDSYKSALEPTQSTIERIHTDYPPSSEQTKSTMDVSNNNSKGVPLGNQKPGGSTNNYKSAAKDKDDKKPVTLNDDIIPYWDNPINNISRRLHTIDPNEHNKKQSIETAKKDWKDLNNNEKKLVILGYSFRHKEADMSNFFQIDPRKSAKNRWSMLTPSMRHHILDPHDILGKKDMAFKNYADLKGEDKKMADGLFDLSKNEESTNLAQGEIV